MNDHVATQQTEQLATEFASVLAKLSPRESDSLMGQFWLTVASKLQGSKSASELDDWSRLHRKLPVPADVLDQARREFDEQSTITELKRFEETGGLRFDEFFPELEQLANPLAGSR